MGKGREIGAQLNAWLAGGDREPLQARLLEGVLLDALGGDARLRGPVRDLALQPLLVKLLQETSPAARRSLLETLVQDLQATYAPAVLGELLDLLEAATGLPVGSRTPSEPGSPPLSPPAMRPSAQSRRRRRRRSGSPQSWGQVVLDLGEDLQPLAPGLALGFANALVFLWLGDELGRLLPVAWSSGLLLLLVLQIEL